MFKLIRGGTFPLNIWEIAILKSVKANGGKKVKLQAIYIKLPTFIDMDAKDLRETKWGGRPAYEHQVRSHISNLRQKGDLFRVSRGLYSISDKGIKRIAL